MTHPSISVAVYTLILFATTNQPVKTILIASETKQVANESQVSANLTVPNRLSLVRLDGNSSFYYDSDAFLLNKNQASGGRPRSTRKESKADDEQSQGVRLEKPGRGGRMLNLDAFVGDLDAVSARSMSNSGNRQSRTFSAGERIDVGNGKKMRVQGFIPIMGLAEQDEDSAKEPMLSSASVKLDRAKELLHGQSSLGHASFGVQRYLNTEQQASPDHQDAMLVSMLFQQQQQQLAQQYQQQASEQKHASNQIQTIGASGSNSVVEALKRPIKKLSSTFSGGSSNVAADAQNCLCVPFYMCRGGYIGESNLSRMQLQQMIAQQSPQLQQPRQLTSELQIAQSTQVQPFDLKQPVETNAELVPYVDERSSEKQTGEQDIVTAPPGTSSELDSSSVSDAHLPSLSEIQSQDSEKLRDQQQPQDLSQQSQSSQSINGSDIDYTQDILGRMLGLKSQQPGRVSSNPAQSQQSSSSCGLLRTCCAVPPHLIAANSDLFLGQSSNAVMQQQLRQPNPDSLSLKQLNSSPFQAQNYPQPLPYGLPSSGFTQPSMPNRAAGSFMNRISTNQYSAPRSPVNQFAPQLNNQVSQLTRAASFVAPAALAAPIATQTFAMNHLALMQQSQQRLQAQNLVRQLPTSISIGPKLGTRRLLEGRCGIRQSAGITGRVQSLQYHESSADFGEYPAQAAILKRLNGNESLFVCAGTLISQQWVATAAHCIKKHSLNELKVRLGEWDVHRDDEFYPYVEMEIRDLVVHPEFMSGNLVNDLALLRLRAPLDPSLAHINPACLPTIDESFQGQKCWVTGWGKDSFGQKGSFQAVLQEVELPVHGHAECEQALKNTRLGAHYRLHAGFICAGGEGGKDACEGDGGSGLYCSSDGGPTKVAGLVSWGIGCGQQGVPGVYINMAHYRPWIENIISIDEDIYSSSYGAPNSQASAHPISTLISERSNSDEAPSANVTMGTGEFTTNSSSTTPQSIL